MNPLIELARAIGNHRLDLVEAKIELKRAKEELEDFESAQRAKCDYNALGKNAQAREIAFSEVLRENADHEALNLSFNASDALVMRLTAQLEQMLDIRRAHEHTTYARLADAKLGEMDHVASEEGMAVNETRRELVQRVAEGAIDGPAEPEFDYEDLQF